MGKSFSYGIIVLALAVFAIANAIFIVNQTEQAIVLQFGEIKRVENTPGLKFKIPFIQNVEYFDKRLLDFNAEPKELITGDNERVIVDAFARYRIVDPIKFYVAVRNEATMNSRLATFLESSIRQTIASVPLKTVLSQNRENLMHTIRESINQQMSGVEVKTPVAVDGAQVAVEEAPTGEKKRVMTSRGFGVEVVDVRIMRTDLPQENSEAVYSRMRSEREREAKEYRAQGAEEALKIRSEADRKRAVILAEAQKKAETMRGEGDAQATRIYNAAFGKDPEFFEFYRTMQAYAKTLGKDDTTVILSPDSGFLRQMDK